MTITALEVRIAREARKVEQIKANREIIIALSRNPVVEIAGAYVLLELLQRAKVLESGAIGTFEEGAVMTGVVAAVMAQQLAPVLPDLLKATTEGVGLIAKALPALAAGG